MESIKLQLRAGMARVYDESIEKPEFKNLVFFDVIADELAERRKTLLEGNGHFGSWSLITDEPGGAEWDDEMRGEYAVFVIYVDDVSVVKEELCLQ